MDPRWLTVTCLLALAMAGAASGCRKRVHEEKRAASEPGGEPVTYSATVVRTIDDGAMHEVTATQFAHSGDWLREEWNQDGEPRIAIWRLDVGKVYLLSPNHSLYIESDLTGSGSEAVPTEANDNLAPAPEALERVFESESSRQLIEAGELPQETVDGHACRVFSERFTLADGSIETSRTFRASDLEWLAIRVETETERSTGRIKVVTERRNIVTAVSNDQFVVPDGFTRVESLRTSP